MQSSSRTWDAWAGHRLTAPETTLFAGPLWACSCGGVFTDPQEAAEHAATEPAPEPRHW